jgi:hypothetical protein
LLKRVRTTVVGSQWINGSINQSINEAVWLTSPVGINYRTKIKITLQPYPEVKTGDVSEAGEADGGVKERAGWMEWMRLIPQGVTAQGEST